jgi:hypothetical protein
MFETFGDGTKPQWAAMGYYLTFLLFEPIMDPTNLIDLSIGLILLERV